MLTVRWDGREIWPDTLIAAARDARRHAWLSADDRRFLHAAGLALAGDAPLPPTDLLRVDLVLHALRGLGWTVGLGAPGPAPAALEDDPEWMALQREVGRLAVQLAAATESLEACRERLDFLRRE